MRQPRPVEALKALLALSVLFRKANPDPQPKNQLNSPSPEPAFVTLAHYTNALICEETLLTTRSAVAEMTQKYGDLDNLGYYQAGKVISELRQRGAKTSDKLDDPRGSKHATVIQAGKIYYQNESAHKQNKPREMRYYFGGESRDLPDGTPAIRHFDIVTREEISRAGQSPALSLAG